MQNATALLNLRPNHIAHILISIHLIRSGNIDLQDDESLRINPSLRHQLDPLSLSIFFYRDSQSIKWPITPKIRPFILAPLHEGCLLPQDRRSLRQYYPFLSFLPPRTRHHTPPSSWVSLVGRLISCRSSDHFCIIYDSLMTDHLIWHTCRRGDS